MTGTKTKTREEGKGVKGQNICPAKMTWRNRACCYKLTHRVRLLKELLINERLLTLHC